MIQIVDLQNVDCYKTSTVTKRRLLQNVASFKMLDYDGIRKFVGRVLPLGWARGPSAAASLMFYNVLSPTLLWVRLG